MRELIKRLTIKTMDKEHYLKVFLSDLKELQAEKIRLELAQVIDKYNGSKVWFVNAYIMDKQNNTLPLRYDCHINSKSNFYDVMSLLANTGYEISVKTIPIPTKLRQQLIARGYTPDEAEETLIRLDCGMKIPKEILEDIKEIYRDEYCKKK